MNTPDSTLSDNERRERQRRLADRYLLDAERRADVEHLAALSGLTVEETAATLAAAVDVYFGDTADGGVS